jgi:hypothetical protein
MWLRIYMLTSALHKFTGTVAKSMSLIEQQIAVIFVL